MFIKEKSKFITGRYRIKINPDYKFKEAIEIIATEESVGIESIAFTDKMRIYSGITDLSLVKKIRFGATYRIIG